LEGFIPEIYGCATRRPGTHKISTQYDETEDVIRLIPFIFSSTVAYSVELGDQYLRAFSTVTDEEEVVYDNGSEVTTTLNVLTTPYLAADIPDLHIRQLGDTMWITHKSYPQYKLTRTSSSSFALNEIEFTKGPFLTRNDLVSPNVTDTALMVIDGTVSFGDITTPGGTVRQFNDTTYFAQTFTCPYDITLSSLYLYLVKAGTPGVTNVQIWDTTNNDELVGSPISTSVLATSTVDLSLVPLTNADWVLITFSTPIVLTANELYSVVVFATGSSSGNSVGWQRINDSSSTYYGRTWNANSPGTSWSIYNAPDQSLKFVSQAVTTPTVNFYGTMSCVDDTSPTPVAVNFFENGHIGSLFKLTYPRTNKVSEGSWAKGSRLSGFGTTGTYTPRTALPFIICPAIDIKGSMRYTLQAHINSATVELQRNENGGGWETVDIQDWDHDINISLTRIEEADNVQYRAVVTACIPTDKDYYLRANITVTNGTQDCVVRILSIIDSSSANIIVVSGIGTTAATRRWAEGAWSPLRGYPCSVAFFEDRCSYLGMTDIQTQVLFDNVPGHVEPKLLKVWLSQTGDYEDFESDVKDADSFDRVVPTANDARWIEAQEALVIGTSGDEWRVGSNKMEQFITPTNATVRKQSTHGSNNIQSITINDQMLFVDSVGRKLRELVYDGDKYRSLDLTAMAEHITDSGITCVAYQHNPDSIVWCCLDDGSLVAMVYEKAEKVIAWFKVPIDGIVKSVCVIPGITEDEVWIAVKRNISGTETVFIEKFANRNFGNYINDAYFLDCGLTYSTAEKVTSNGYDVTWEGQSVMSGDRFSTVSGLSYLNGETVSVLADGAVFDDAVVSSGAITLKLDGTTKTAQKAHVGKKYRSKLVPMRMVTGTPYGSSQGMITRVPKMSINFLNSLDVQYGASDAALSDINFNDAVLENSEDSIADLFTGEVTVSVNGGFSVQNPIVISTDSPLPCVIRSLAPRLEASGS